MVFLQLSNEYLGRFLKLRHCRMPFAGPRNERPRWHTLSQKTLPKLIALKRRAKGI